MLKDLMHAIFDEDIEDEDVEEETVEPVEEQAAVTVQPVVQNTNTSIDTVVEELEKNPEGYKDSPIFEKAIIQKPEEKKSTLFEGLDVDSISKEEVKPKPKAYKYDRHKAVKVRRVAEDLEYQAVISPIFGNVEDSKKEFDKVHDAITLSKPEDLEVNQILSPMFGTHLPSMQPAKSIPEYKVNEKKSDSLNLSDMLEKSEKTTTKQATLFDKEGE